MTVMLVALLLIPFIDRAEHEPESTRAAFDLRKRGLAFIAMGVFLIVLIAGVVQNAISEAG